MATLFDQLVDRPLASAFGVIGLVCLAIWPVFRSRSAILMAQLAIGVAYTLHYALLDARTGALVTALGAAQTLSTVHRTAGCRLHRIAFAFLPLPAVAAWATWIGPPSLLAATALTLIMIGRMQCDEFRMRVILLAATPVGMAYDLIVGSLPAFAGGAIAMLIGAAMLHRLVVGDRRAAHHPSMAIGNTTRAHLGQARSAPCVA